MAKHLTPALLAEEFAKIARDLSCRSSRTISNRVFAIGSVRSLVDWVFRS